MKKRVTAIIFTLIISFSIFSCSTVNATTSNEKVISNETESTLVQLKEKEMKTLDDYKEKIYDADFVTVNPYMGTDCVKPFIEDSKKYEKGVFVLVKTSNKSSGELQDLKLENGNKVYEHVAQLVEEWGKDLRGKYGYSSISAVVGATYPEQLKEIRKLAPHTFFLIPGYGAQGGKAEDIALGFDENGIGGIVNASRSLMCAYKSDRWKNIYSEEQFAEATRAEALRMREELVSAIKK